jgi:signal transduction histidine kinase
MKAKSRPGMRHHLFWRMYFHNLALLVVVGVFLAFLFSQFRHHSPWHNTPMAVAEHLRDVPEERLQAELEAISLLVAVDLAVYQVDGQRLASAGTHALEALCLDSALALSPDRSTFEGRHQVTVLLDQNRYLILRWRGGDPSHLLWIIGGLLVLLGLVSLPRARAIARPLEAMLEVTEQIGAGDLDARVRSEKRRAPRDLVRLGQAINQMADGIARLRGHERALLSAVSHELRTPMARIRVALEWAAEEGTLPMPLDGVEGDLAELEALVENILASNRLIDGAFPLNTAPTDMTHLAQSEVARFNQQHPERSVELALTDAECTVDARLVSRVLRNLLSNAERYTDGPLRLESAQDATSYVFTLLDRGPGLSERDRALVFEPFFRAEASRARATGGVGLGLTLSRRIVEAHGGWIEANAREGGGLSIRFGLPHPQIA